MLKNLFFPDWRSKIQTRLHQNRMIPMMKYPMKKILIKVMMILKFFMFQIGVRQVPYFIKMKMTFHS